MMLLPEPAEIDNIARMYSVNKLFGTPKEWFAKYDYVKPAVNYLKKHNSVKRSNGRYEQLNLHMLQRSLNQANQACNKLWASVELFKQIEKNDVIIKPFNKNFISSSMVPSLHYANISALVSLLSLFGICSWVERFQKMRFYNIIRTGDAIHWKERKSHLIELFSTSKNGWHSQVIQMYFGLTKKGIKLPQIDRKDCEKILDARNRYDYDILTQTSMYDVYGFETYVELLPIATKSVKCAIEYLQKVISPLPNGCDSRFVELEKMVTIILKT
jgi:hypothetical protein